MTPAEKNPNFTYHMAIEGSKARLMIAGRLDSASAAMIWGKMDHLLSSDNFSQFSINLSELEYLDTAGAGAIAFLEHQIQTKKNKAFAIEHLNPDHESLLERARQVQNQKPPAGPDEKKRHAFIDNLGQRLAGQYSEIKEFITYVGQITWALLQSLRHPGSIRWRDAIRIAERAGVDALPIVALISFIVGLVMAFQAAIPMRMFGAELYVANLIGISMVRELAPLMTAIVLAGRSASAFAAEIGTMRINEEIDALTVMGLDPVRFLIVPRVIASTIMTPLLTLFANLMGILGGALVITSFGYPIISYYNQIVSFVGLNDFLGGLVKCFVFGILIAATGCIRGYQTQSGASAVGISTTRAVVSGIILIAVFDGIFSIVYYYLGI